MNLSVVRLPLPGGRCRATYAPFTHWRSGYDKTLRMLKCTVLLLVACLQVGAKGISQVTLSERNAPLSKVFKEIRRQTGYDFIYTYEQLEQAGTVTVALKKAPLEEALEICLRGKGLVFEIKDKTVVIRKIALPLPAPAPPPASDLLPAPVPGFQDVKGRVSGESGEPVGNATVSIRKLKRMTMTDANGQFTLEKVPAGTHVLEVSSVGYAPFETVVEVHGENRPVVVLVSMKKIVSSLDETIVMAYGTTSRRLNTGNISKVSSEDIQRQPVTNPLAALQGRVAGLNITQTNGVPGSAFKVQIRGVGSLLNKSDPLFIVDGVPFAPGNGFLNQRGSAVSNALPGSGNLNPSTSPGSGISPFILINPADIESVEVLKDADATAIYGSRGANGVVLITTRKAKAGKTSFSVNAWSGISKVIRMPEMMNTRQYLTMRREAFKNDSITPTITNAPDLLAWDTTRYVNWPKLLIGGTARTTNVNASATGGSSGTQFLIGLGYNQETTVYPWAMPQYRTSADFALTHYSTDRKFSIELKATYSSGGGTLPGGSAILNLPPNAPFPYDSSGKLNWAEKGASFQNPFALSNYYNKQRQDNLISHLHLGYKISSNLSLKSGFGYQTSGMNEVTMTKISSKNPYTTSILTGSSSYGIQNWRLWSVEPYLEYSRRFGRSKLVGLFGGSWQLKNSSSILAWGDGYTNDALIESLSAAPIRNFSNDLALYKYVALYGRINYNWEDKYLLNLTVNRDGSSRFGPGKQYNNFGSLAAAWIFSSEKFIKRSIPSLSFGKLRGSIGVTGNDQIGDYMYLNTWSTAGGFPGISSIGLYPDRLFNPDFRWERTTKMEAGLELGWWNNRLTASAVYYRHKCDNQLLNYRLPTQTGFYGVMRNFPATFVNDGLEFELGGDIINSRILKWNVSINLTIPRNRLTAFPGIEKSTYSSWYIIGQSVNILRKWHSLGVDPVTGVYRMEDVDKNGNMSTSPTDPDFHTIGTSDPKYFGGLRSEVTYKGFDMLLFFEFKKQLGPNYLYTTYYSFTPGTMNNQPVYIFDRWQKSGDISSVQKYTASIYSPASAAIRGLASYADIVYSDASYIRLKSVNIGYNLPVRWTSAAGLGSCKIYFQAQNLLLFTPMKYVDPEASNNITSVPPLRTMTAGIQINL